MSKLHYMGDSNKGPHGGGSSPRCHSFVTDGRIQFLSDCTHKLVGQTVEIPEWEA